jgi:hypothetical protein
MARRGQYPPRVERFLRLFQRHYIDQGATPNRAAELVANEHWRTTPSPTWEACVAWLKRNERENRDKLQRLQQRDPLSEMQELYVRFLRNWDTLMQQPAQQK